MKEFAAKLSRNALLLAIALGFEIAVPTSRAETYSVYVGYADNLRANPLFPSVWAADANVYFAGGGSSFDAGAVRIQNTGAAPITVSDVHIEIPPSPDGGA